MDLREFLQREFRRRTGRNRRYSLRAFARDLGCDHSTLSQWLRGTRPITVESVDRLCQRLGIAGMDRRRICELTDMDLMVVEAARTSAARTSPSLAELLGLTVDQVNLSLTRLMRLHILRMRGNEWEIVEGELA
jgi:transcriptional regulator with XRE-family HTH domain